MKYLIKNANLIGPKNEDKLKRDILIENGRIKRIDKSVADGNAKVLNAHGCLVLPGLVDIHTHLREPGEEEKEDLTSGSRAALAGGFTRVLCMPNTKPSLDTFNLIKSIVNSPIQGKYIRIHPVGAVTRDRKGNQLTDMKLMLEAGAAGFSDDGNYIQNLKVLRSALKYASGLGTVLYLHEEDNNLSPGTCLHEGRVSFKTGIKGVPSTAESCAVARDIMISLDTGCRVHFQHLSDKESVRIIRKVKTEVSRITAEVTPHHLIFSEEDVESLNPVFKVNPPLRSRKDREALLEGLNEGTIDVIATDHAPHTAEEKERPFKDAPPGMIGLECSFGAIYTCLVLKEKMSVNKLVETMSVNPRKIAGIPEAKIKEGAVAEISIMDISKSQKLEKDALRSKSSNTPFLGKELYGWPKWIFVEGSLRLDEGKLLGDE